MFWQSQVVAVLRECKDYGLSFDEAWIMALEEHPPRGTGFGNGRRQLEFPEEGEPTLVEFLRAACEDAWHGRRPHLAALSTDLLDLREGRGSAVVG